MPRGKPRSFSQLNRNRTRMTDGVGQLDYTYDALSRPLSEKHTINDPDNASIADVEKTLSYDYNLADQLKQIADPAGGRIDYSYDDARRLAGVAGSGVLYGDVSTYASGCATAGSWCRCEPAPRTACKRSATAPARRGAHLGMGPRAGEPAEADQAPDVWAGELRPTPRPRPVCRLKVARVKEARRRLSPLHQLIGRTSLFCGSTD